MSNGIARSSGWERYREIFSFAESRFDPLADEFFGFGDVLLRRLPSLSSIARAIEAISKPPEEGELLCLDLLLGLSAELGCRRFCCRGDDDSSGGVGVLAAERLGGVLGGVVGGVFFLPRDSFFCRLVA